jgi:hypothetical protein
MNISFKPQFVHKILDRTKIHTVRQDEKERWQTDTLMHMIVNPRTPQQVLFNRAVCYSVQEIEIPHFPFWIQIKVDGRFLTESELMEFIKNDGFDTVEEFVEWFPVNFKGRLIHWTDKKY